MEEPENETNDRSIKLIILLTLAAIATLIFFGVLEADRKMDREKNYIDGCWSSLHNRDYYKFCLEQQHQPLP